MASWWKYMLVGIVLLKYSNKKKKKNVVQWEHSHSALLYRQQWLLCCQLSGLQNLGLNCGKGHCQHPASVGCEGKLCSFRLEPMWRGIRFSFRPTEVGEHGPGCEAEGFLRHVQHRHACAANLIEPKGYKITNKIFFKKPLLFTLASLFQALYTHRHAHVNRAHMHMH